MARRPGKEIRVSASDALEFEPEPVRRRRVPTTVWMLLALILITGAGLGGFLFGDRLASLGTDGPRQVPVVHAETGSIKVRPINPGGAEIPFRGYDINKRMTGEGASTRVEALLPAPEKPEQPPTAPAAAPAPAPGEATAMGSPGNAPISAPERQGPVAPASVSPPLAPVAPVPQAPAGRTAAGAEPLLPPAPPAPAATPSPGPSTPPTTVVNQPSPPAAMPSPPAAAPPSPPPAPSTSAITATAVQPPPPDTPADAPIQLVPKAAPPPVTKPLTPVRPPVTTRGAPKPENLLANRSSAATAPSTTQTSAKGWQIQLAASRAAKAARSEGERLKKKHADLLGAYSVRVMRADLGAKGVFYRIRLGALPDRAAARQVCARLSQRGQGCLVVAPGK